MEKLSLTVQIPALEGIYNFHCAGEYADSGCSEADGQNIKL